MQNYHQIKSNYLSPPKKKAVIAAALLNHDGSQCSAISHLVSGLSSHHKEGSNQKFCSPNKTIEVRSDTIIFAVASSVFGICVMMSLASSILQISLKKRQLASMVFFIETVAFTTNISQYLQIFPDMRDHDGKPFDWLHYVQWFFTTSTMLVTLSSFGTDENSHLVYDWTSTRSALLSDWMVLLTGFGSSCVVRVLLWSISKMAIS